MYLNQVFSAYIKQVDFYDLDFVEAPAAPGPSKSGVGCLDFVGLRVSKFPVQMLCFLVL